MLLITLQSLSTLFHLMMKLQFDLTFVCPKKVRYSLLKCIWQRLKSPCFSKLMNSLYSIVNPVCLYLWSPFFMGDLDNDTSTSWRGFFRWLNDVKVVFFTLKTLWSSIRHLFFFLCWQAQQCTDSSQNVQKCLMDVFVFTAKHFPVSQDSVSQDGV